MVQSFLDCLACLMRLNRRDHHFLFWVVLAVGMVCGSSCKSMYSTRMSMVTLKVASGPASGFSMRDQSSISSSLMSATTVTSEALGVGFFSLEVKLSNDPFTLDRSVGLQIWFDNLLGGQVGWGFAHIGEYSLYWGHVSCFRGLQGILGCDC